MEGQYLPTFPSLFKRGLGMGGSSRNEIVHGFYFELDYSTVSRPLSGDSNRPVCFSVLDMGACTYALKKKKKRISAVVMFSRYCSLT